MTRRTNLTRPERDRPTGSRLRPRSAALSGVAVAGLAVAALAIWRSADGDTTASLSAPDPGPVHVHGLGVDPADGALFIATHTGLFRVGQGRRTAERVGGRYQDTMGFTVVGPNRFLGSGHPDLMEAREKGLPSLLGLVESTDAGESWRAISLSGEADFHVLRVAGERVYGYDASHDRLLVSDDGGSSWRERRTPGSVIDLAVDPRDGRHVVATTDAGLSESRDAGESWTQAGDVVGLVAWSDRLYVVAGDGSVLARPTGGGRLVRRGEIGGRPAAFAAAGAGTLYVALHDGTVERSTDGGATWAVRSAP